MGKYTKLLLGSLFISVFFVVSGVNSEKASAAYPPGNVQATLSSGCNGLPTPPGGATGFIYPNPDTVTSDAGGTNLYAAAHICPGSIVGNVTGVVLRLNSYTRTSGSGNLNISTPQSFSPVSTDGTGFSQASNPVAISFNSLSPGLNCWTYSMTMTVGGPGTWGPSTIGGNSLCINFSPPAAPPAQGNIYTTKYFPGSKPAGSDVSGQPAEVNNASVCLTNRFNNTFACSGNNKWNVGGILVSGNAYRVSVNVPAGYRLSRAVAGGQNRIRNCTNSSSFTGTCSITFNIAADQNNYVDFWFERITGTIYTTKYYPDNHPANGIVSGQPSQVNTASVCLTNGSGNTFACAPNNPWSVPGILTTDNNYRVSVNVPAGYRLSRSNRGSLTCTGAGNTGTCRITLTVIANQNNFVDFWFEETDDPPSGSMSANCTRVRIDSVSDPQGATNVRISINGDNTPGPGNTAVYRSAGQTFDIPNEFKTFNTKSVTGVVQNVGFSGSALNVNISARNIGPCDGRPRGRVEAACVVDGNPGDSWITVTGSDDVDDRSVNPAGYKIEIEHNGNWDEVENVDVDDDSITIDFPNEYKDAFSRQVRAVIKNRGPGGIHSDGSYDTTLDPINVSACNPPKCELPTTTPPTPEVGDMFGVLASFIYSGVTGDNSKIRALRYTTTVSVDGTTTFPSPQTQPTTDFYWSVIGTGIPDPPGVSADRRRDSTDTGRIFTIPNAGKYRIQFSMTYSHPTLSPLGGGDVRDCSAENEAEIARYPYYKIYGNDGQAGGVFESTAGVCPASVDESATFRGFNKGVDLDYVRGAGAQYGLFALATIQEVASANLRPFTGSNLELGPGGVYSTRETFANTKLEPAPATLIPDYGGESGIYRCIPDWFSTKPATASLETGSVFIAAQTLGNTTSQTRYIEGDVIIEGDIMYDTFNSALNAPNFTLIVKGNIYINPNVTQLDGTYIAQPDDTGAGGQIITCNVQLNSQLNDSCDDSKLQVNGALIAKKIVPWRTIGTLSGVAAAGEPAEVFQFSPEVYLKPTDFGGNSEPKKYDSITTLPPIF